MTRARGKKRPSGAAACCGIVLPVLSLLTLCGCPVGYIIPPFDATGTYAGTWEAALEGATETVRCSCTLVLEQDLAADFPKDHVLRGTITLNMTCPSALRELGRLGFPGIVHIETTGVQFPDGRLYFASGDCVELDCQGIVLSATGADADKDGYMDAIDGDWQFGALLGTNIALLSGVLTATAP